MKNKRRLSRFNIANKLSQLDAVCLRKQHRKKKIQFLANEMREENKFR